MRSTCGATRRELLGNADPRGMDDSHAAARRHAAECPSCREFFSDMAALQLGARAVRAGSTPAGFRERLFDRIAERRIAEERIPEKRIGAPRRRAATFIWGGFAAVAAAGLFWIALSVAPSDASPLVVAVAQDHANAVSGDRLQSADPAIVERWLGARLAFAVRVPELDGASLVGARVCVTSTGRGGVVEYRVAGEILSYFILPPQPDPLPDESGFHHGRADGYRAVVWRDTGLVHAMVGRLPGPMLERFARECVKQAATVVSMALWQLLAAATRHAAGPTASLTSGGTI